MNCLRSMSRTSRSVVAALLAGGLLVACGSSGDGDGSKESENKPYDIVAVLGTTGPLAAASTAASRGIKASVDYLNAHGGINGRHVKVDVLNDQGDATKAVSLLQSKLTGSKPDMVYTGISSDEALALQPVTNRAGVLSFCMAASAKLDDPKNYPYSFSNTTQMEPSIERAVTYMKSKHVKKVGILLPSNAYGDTVAAAFDANLPGSGITGDMQRFDANALDFTSAYKRAAAKNPDMLFVDVIGAPTGRLLTDRMNAGLSDIPTLAGQGFGSINLPTTVDSAALKNVQVLYWSIMDKNAERPPAFADFVSALKKQGPVEQPIYVYSMAYDAVQLAAFAAENAKGDKAADLTAALETATPPETAPWFTWAQYGYTGKSHFPATTKDDFVVLPAGALADGQLAQ